LKRIHRRIDIEADVSLSCFSETWLFGVAEQPFFLERRRQTDLKENAPIAQQRKMVGYKYRLSRRYIE